MPSWISPRKKRLLAAAALSLVALVLVVLVAVQVVLSWTNIPRDLVVDQLQSATGMGVEIDALETSWWGSTTIRGLRITSPDELQPLLTANRVRVQHRSLPALAWTGDPGLESLRIDDANLLLVQDKLGQWNLIQAIQDILARQEDKPDKADKPTALPSVLVRNTTLDVVWEDGRRLQLSPIWARLESTENASNVVPASDFALRIGRMLQAQGKVTFDDTFTHDVQVSLDDPAVLQPLLAGLPLSPTQADLHWRGRVKDDQLVGEADIQQLLLTQPSSTAAASAARVTLTGQLGLQAGQSIVLTPANLKLVAPHWLPSPVTAESGTLTWKDHQLTLQDLRIQTLQGQLAAGGTYHVDTRTLDSQLSWRELVYPASVTQAGTLNLKAQQTPLGQVAAQGTLNSQGAAAGVIWEAAADFDAQGQSWNDIRFTLSTKEAQIKQGDFPITTNQGQLTGQWRDQTLTLERFTLPVQLADEGTITLTGQGQADLAAQIWSLDAQAQASTPDPENKLQASGQLAIQGDGDQWRAELSDFQLAQLTGSAKFTLDPSQPQSFQGQYTFNLAPPPATPAIQQATINLLPTADAEPANAPPTRVIWKDVSLRGRVNGQLSPLDLRSVAQLQATDLALGPADPQPQTLTLTLSSQIDPQAMVVKSDSFALAGAQLALNARHGFDEARSTLELAVRDLPVAVLDRIARSPLALTGYASADLLVAMDRFDPATLDVAGQWTARDIEHPRLLPTQAAGKILLRDGQLQLVDVVAQSGSGKARGSIRAAMESLNQVTAELDVDHWPVRLGEGEVYRVDATGKLRIDGDLAQKRFAGPVTLNLALIKDDWAFLTADLDMLLSHDAGQVLLIRSLRSRLLEGSVQGQAEIHLDDITQSHAQVMMKGVNLSRLEAWQPMLSSLTGKVDGKLILEPTHDPRAHGPLRLTMTLRPVDLQVQRVELNAMNMLAFISPDRVLIHDLNIALASGKLHAWGRITQQEGQWFGYAQSDWSNLSFDQLASLMLIVQTPEATAGRMVQQVDQAQASSASSRKTSPTPEPIPGLFDGNLQVTGPIQDWTKASGSGQVKVSESDLVRVPILGELYALLNIGSSNTTPTGFGSAAFRLEGPALVITDAAYINRGISVNLRLRLKDLRQGMNTPIQGLAVGIYNPLPTLPGVQRYVDAIMNYQGNATTIAISGQLDNRKLQRVPATIIGQLTQDLLYGKETEAEQSPSSESSTTDAIKPIAQPREVSPAAQDPELAEVEEDARKADPAMLEKRP